MDLKIAARIATPRSSIPMINIPFMVFSDDLESIWQEVILIPKNFE